MRITKEFLVSLRACEEQVSLFEKVFPEGAELNTENLKLAAEKGLELVWLFINAKLSGAFVDRYGDGYWFVNGLLYVIVRTVRQSSTGMVQSTGTRMVNSPRRRSGNRVP